MQNMQQLQLKKARVYRHVRLTYFAYFAYVAYLHIMHIYVDNPCQLTFVFAEGLIDSDDGISSTHSLDELHSNPDGQDCPDGNRHTSAPPSPTFSIGRPYLMGDSCALGLRGPASAVLVQCYYDTGLREGRQHDCYACVNMRDLFGARQVRLH